MIDDFPRLVLGIFLTYGYFAILIGVMLDNVGIPVPGELSLLIAGSLVASGNLTYLPAVAVAAVGAVLSDSLWFYVGRRGSRRLMQLYCRVSFGSTACLAKTEQQMSRFGPKSLLYARFLPGFRTFASPMAGMSGMLYRQFLLYDGIGSILWACFGIAMGSIFAHRINALFGMLDRSRTILFYLLGVLLLLFFMLKLLVRWQHGRAKLPLKQED